MPRFRLPNNASIHTAHSFLAGIRPFADEEGDAVLEFHPRWAHVEPMALAMVASWGAWCRSIGKTISIEHLARHIAYAARMRLFQHLGVAWDPGFREHEESGRFLPLRQVRHHDEVAGVMGEISALLHLDREPESLTAVQYCISELIRNVLEHSGSPDGAFVCGHRYTKKHPHRVTIAVADCGFGIAEHLGRVHPEALEDDKVALALALRPGITGSLPGIYGTPDNAGAGLFITRCIAKGTGGYFLILSGNAAYRLRRSERLDDQVTLYADPLDERRYNLWQVPTGWKGTVVTVEIRTDKIEDFSGFFEWIFKKMPGRSSLTQRIRFT